MGWISDEEGEEGKARQQPRQAERGRWIETRRGALAFPETVLARIDESQRATRPAAELALG